MKPEHKKYIRENVNAKPVREIAEELHLSERSIRRFLKGGRRKKPPQPKRQDRQPANRKERIVSIVLIAIVGFAVYANSLGGAFLWDDEKLVRNNLFIRNWSHLEEIFTDNIKAGVGQSSNFYRPVQVFSYLVDYTFWELNVVGYHLTNVIFHVLTALAVYWLIDVLFHDHLLAFLTGLFFVVHPIHTEAVAYISGRADSQAALFMLLCLIFYVKSLNMKSIGITVLMCFSYSLALLSRENSLLFPFLLLIYHYAFACPLDKKRFSLLVAIEIGYILLRLAILPAESSSTASEPSLTARLPGFFVAFTEYLRLLVAPFNLHMEYGGMLFQFSEPKALIGILLFAAVVAFAAKKRRTNRLVFFAIAWFLVTLTPSSNIIYTINAYMAEHWLYMPSIGFFLILARPLVYLFRDRQLKVPAVSIAVVLLVLFSFLTIRQNRLWREPIGFYSYTLRHTPYQSRLFNNLAEALHKAGRDDEIISLLEASIKLDPGYSTAYNNLGNAYKNAGRYEEAKRAYEKALELDPDDPSVYYNLSLIYADWEKNNDKALELLEKAIRINPYYFLGYHKKGLIYAGQGKFQEAIAMLDRAIAIDPKQPSLYHSLGYIYIKSGNKEKAKMLYRKTIELDSTYTKAYHDLAIIYYNEGNHSLAVQYADKAKKYGDADTALQKVLDEYRSFAK